MSRPPVAVSMLPSFWAALPHTVSITAYSIRHYAGRSYVNIKVAGRVTCSDGRYDTFEEDVQSPPAPTPDPLLTEIVSDVYQSVLRQAKAVKKSGLVPALRKYAPAMLAVEVEIANLLPAAHAKAHRRFQAVERRKEERRQASLKTHILKTIRANARLLDEDALVTEQRLGLIEEIHES